MRFLAQIFETTCDSLGYTRGRANRFSSEVPMNRVRSLKDELHSNDTREIPPQPCSLAQKKTCCNGAGYRLTTKGSLTHAELCKCVMECPSCFGLNRYVENGASKVCADPAPSRVATLINCAQLPARYATAQVKAFSNFSGNGKESVAKVTQWIKEFDIEKPKGLILGGSVGLGKTYLLVSIAKYFASIGMTVRFVDFFQLLFELKEGYEKKQNDSRVLREAIEVDVLFIDELGKGRSSDWELSILDQLVMGRYNQNKVIVATTNYDLKPTDVVDVRRKSQKALDENRPGSFQLQYEPLEERIGTRIYSRLVETSEFLIMHGDDFRKKDINKKLLTNPKDF